MKYLHTMIRVTDLKASLAFYCEALGLVEVARHEVPAGRFTLAFLCAPEDIRPVGPIAAPVSPAQAHRPALELTYNWDAEQYEAGRNFGHLAFGVSDIYETCQKLMDSGVVINRPPRDGKMAFVRSPDDISIELLQSGLPLEAREPWVTMPNSGAW